tara:strand:- start:1210 stop:1461 length:252 start_codon:yes stop_codon:yes gene_type:complete
MKTTKYHAKYCTYKLTKRSASDNLEKLTSTLSNAFNRTYREELLEMYLLRSLTEVLEITTPSGCTTTTTKGLTKPLGGSPKGC